MRPKTLILYCGGGVQHMGLDPVIDVKLALDWDEGILLAHRRNHPGVPTRCRNLMAKPEACLRGLDITRGKVDILQMSPPCPGFSISNEKRLRKADVRRWHTVHCLDWIRHLMPRVVVIENVMGLARMVPGIHHWKVLRAKLEDLGYVLPGPDGYWLLDSWDFGLPQTRHRVFIVGTLGGKAVPPPKATFAGEEKLVLADVLHALTEREWVREGCAPMSKKRSEDLSLVPQGGYMESGSPRPRMDKPSTALITEPSKMRYSKHVHPIRDRHLSVREYCYIMGVPEYKFPSILTESQKYLVIGNGNPPQVLEQVYKQIKRHVWGKR